MSECDATDVLNGTPARHHPGCEQNRAWTIGSRPVAIVAAILLAVGLTATLLRIVVDYQTPGPFNHDAQGLCDFHNGIYFPTRAVLIGESPYSEAYARKYPVARQIPFFSPIILLLHAPLAVVPLHVGEVLNLVLQLVMLTLIVLLVSRAAGMPRRIDFALGVAAFVVFSRGGHITLFNGYFTFQVVLATWLAIQWADRRPIASSLMLFVVSAKPTYILPLGFLMLARGHVRALAYGAALSITGTALTLGWLAYHEGGSDLIRGTSVLADQIVQTQAVHRSMEDESPVFSWTRLDLFAIIAKWRGEDPGDLPHLLTMFAFLPVPMWILWRRRHRDLGSARLDAIHDVNPKETGISDGNLGGLSGAVLLTTVLVSLYHQSYDSLLLTVPIAALIAGRISDWRDRPWWVRFGLAGLLAFPAMNYLSTRLFLLRFDVATHWVKVFTSLNGVVLAIGLVILCMMSWPRIKTNSPALETE